MNRFLRYLKQSRVEFSKVVWPSRQTALRYTGAVIVFTIVLSVFIGAMDYVFTQGIQRIILQG